MELKVSVIMPVYNGSQFLNLAVKSVIGQTYGHWELLLIDDGSTDNSLKCMMELAKIDSRIKILFHDGHANRGVSATRNLGIKNAQGEYVALLDCDDEWFPNKLEKQVRIIEEHSDAVLVYSMAVSVDEEGVELAKSNHHFIFPHICGTGLPNTRDAVVTGLILGPVWMPALTVIMNTDCVRDLGGFDETLKFQVEDHLLFTLLAADGPVYFIDEILAKYRVHKKSYTQTTQWKYSLLEYYDRLYDKLPASFHRVLTSARVKQISNELVTVKSFSTLSGSIIAAKTVTSELFKNRLQFNDKMELISGLAHNLLKQLRQEVSRYPTEVIKRFQK